MGMGVGESGWDSPILTFISVHLSQYFLTIAFSVLAAVLAYAAIWRENEAAVSIDISVPLQCDPIWSGDLLEEPTLEVPDSSDIQCYCPTNGMSLGTIRPASSEDIDDAIIASGQAQKRWKTTSYQQRRKVLQTLLRYILENQQTICRAACLDSGKTWIDASLGEILVTVEKLKWTISHGEKSLRTERRPTNFLMSYKLNEVRWEPLGIVAACVSWNYPFHNVLGPVISAIFAGNAIIVKSSEATAWATIYFVDIVRSALRACDHSEDLVQSIVCWPDVAPYLTSHPSISHLTFIGSRQVALAVAASAAQSLTPLCAELGGKDAAVILSDVQNLEKVASILMRGTFQSAGQNCIGIERIIACETIYDRLVNILTPRIKALRVGDALQDGEEVDVGAMISANGFDRLETLIEAAVADGARCIAGGKRFNHPKHPKGHYFTPTLVVDVTLDMQIAQEETFAPICLVMKATNAADAIRIANSTEYGLGASVFGSDAAEVEKVVAGFQTGMVSVNDFGVYYAVQLPFGGARGSGYGRFAGEEGLRSLCNTKAVCKDRFPRLVSTAIPKPLDYPIANAKRAWEMCTGIVELGYGESWGRVFGGLWKVIRNG